MQQQQQQQQWRAAPPQKIAGRNAAAVLRGVARKVAYMRGDNLRTRKKEKLLLSIEPTIPLPPPSSTAATPPHTPCRRSKVEELNSAGNPDEKDMDRYLKAHDDLQTVLRVYDSVLDGNEALPLSRGATAAAAAGRSTGQATAAAEAAFAARVNGNGDGGGAYTSDDDSVEDGGGGGGSAAEGGGRGARRGRAAAAAAGAASGGRSSPAKGNLLDLEENAPLETGMTGEGAGGMMVAYADGRFMASNTNTNTNSVGGVSGLSGVSGVGMGFDSSSSGPQGSATASNYASASDTGAVYGSNQFGSNNLGSNNFGSSNFSSGGGVGDGPSGFGEWKARSFVAGFLAFFPADCAPAPPRPAPHRTPPHRAGGFHRPL